MAESRSTTSSFRMEEPDILPDLKAARSQLEKLRADHEGDGFSSMPRSSTTPPLHNTAAFMEAEEKDGDSIVRDDASLTSMSQTLQITPAGIVVHDGDGRKGDNNDSSNQEGAQRLDDEGDGEVWMEGDGVERAGGSSLEGSNTTESKSRKSLKRAPTDPSKFNAVTVHLCYATGIRKWDASCDPFALVTVGQAKTTFEEKLGFLEETGYHDSLYETRVIENTTEPEWNEVCTLAIPPNIEKPEIHVQVQDKDMSSNEDLGEAHLRLTKFVCDDAENPTEAELPLEGAGAGNDEPSIWVKLNFTNVDDETYDGSSVSGSMVSAEGLSIENKRELMHPGEWVPDEWGVGRKKSWTGYWTCCGNDKHLSMYCPSLGDRVDFAHKLAERIEHLRLQPIKEAKAKELREKWLKERDEMRAAKIQRKIDMQENNGEEPLSEMEMKHFFMSKEWKKKKGIWREPVTDKLSEAHGADENDLYEHRMRMVKPADIGMIVGTMRKNINNHWMINQAMDIIQRLLDQRDAQKKCIQFGALPQVIKGLKIHAQTYDIQILGMKALYKYTLYTPTQEKAMLTIDVTNMAITRLKMFRDKEETVWLCMEILKFTSKLRVNRARIYEAGTITQIIYSIVGYKKNTKILCAAFFLLENLSSMALGKEEVRSTSCEEKPSRTNRPNT